MTILLSDFVRVSDESVANACLSRMSRKRDEPVRLTRIYTRGGDTGETSLGGGSRVPKTDPRVEAVGEVDELNSLLGWSRAIDGAPLVLARIQNELFDLGADLATPPTAAGERLRVSQELVDRLESDCDAVNDELEPLKSFVLPGGTELAARLFVARRQRARRRNPLEAGRVGANVTGRVDPTRYQRIGLIEPPSTRDRAWSGEGS